MIHTPKTPEATEILPKTPPHIPPIMSLSGVRRTFGTSVAVKDIDLHIREGEFLTIVGPSGSGKTTLMRMLAGMDAPTEGKITLRGKRINETPANKRPTCMVFQSLALFPHKSVGENISISLKVRGVPAAERRKRALELMRVVRLPEDYHDKNVTKCSGGERQRVALARAFAYDPEVLFFDEPLSALDYKLKKALEKELKQLHQHSGKTFVYITHSLEEAMVMSDRIGVMCDGALVQVGTPDDIYNAPRTRFVAEFLGEVNTLPVARNAAGDWTAPGLGTALVIAPPQQGKLAETATLTIRPESLRFVPAGARADNMVTGIIEAEYSLGSRMQYRILAGETVFLIETAGSRPVPAEGSGEVTIGWDAKDAFTFVE